MKGDLVGANEAPSPLVVRLVMLDTNPEFQCLKEHIPKYCGLV